MSPCKYQFALLCIAFIVFNLVLSQDSCPAKPKDEEIEAIFRLLGYPPSCSLTALKVCDSECKVNFTETFKHTEEAIAYVSKSLQEIIANFQNLQKCINNSHAENNYSDSASPRPKTCLDLYDAGDTSSGVKKVFPHIFCPEKELSVYCDQETDGGGWTVIQRRTSDQIPRENFVRNYTDYVNGFGNVTGEFWMGLNLIHLFTDRLTNELRIDLEDEQGVKRFAKYTIFRVGSAFTSYTLTVNGFSGNAGDALTPHDGALFSAVDVDNDEHDGSCASMFKGAWWYKKCHSSNLNGYSYEGKITSYADGITWKTFRGYHYSLSKVQMAIRST